MDSIVLKFDEMTEDHQLAYKYITLNNAQFYPNETLPREKSAYTKFVNDSCGNVIYYKDFEDYVHYSEDYLNSNYKNRRNMFGLLADKIEENAELFSQLESLIRKVPKEEVKNCDIKLLIQWFRCFQLRFEDENFLNQYWSCLSGGLRKGYYYFHLFENDPLCKFGLISILLLDHLTILAEPNTAVLCHLFTKLCNDAGFECDLLFLPSKSARDNIFSGISGCFGAITEQADVDSAVDALLASTNWYPWKLQALYIQESVFETAKKIFQWKCDTSDEGSTIFQYNGRRFIFDYAAEDTEGIRVEAYRTTKELISIIAERNPTFLSLWCSNNAHANEICFAPNVNASLVWVNDIGTFDGPLRSSEGFYSILHVEQCIFIKKIDDVYTEKLYKLRESWLKKSVLARAKILSGIFSKHAMDIHREELITHCSNVNNENDNFIQIESGSIVIGDCKPVITILDTISYFILPLFKALIHGTMVIYKYNKYESRAYNNNNDEIAEALAQNGFPIVFFDEKAKSKKLVKVLASPTPVPIMMTKVVRHSFGTIFAN